MSLEAKLEIMEALAAYSHTLDNGDDAGWVALFTPDAVWEGWPKGAPAPSIRWEGHDGITRFAGQMRANNGETQIRHIKVNTVYLELTDSLARIRSNGFLLATPPGGEPRVALTGIYAETLVKVGGAWKIRRCALYMDR